MDHEQITVRTTPTTTDDELYCRYEGQTSAQPVSLTLDTETGVLTVDYDGNIGGNCRSMREFHHIDRSWSIPPLRVHAVRALMDAITDDCQTILDHSTVEWDGNNNVGRLDEDGQEAYDRVESACDEYASENDPGDVYDVWDASDYYAPSDPMDDIDKLTIDSTDDEIATIAKSEVADAEYALDVDDVERHLIQCRDEAIEEAE